MFIEVAAGVEAVPEAAVLALMKDAPASEALFNEASSFLALLLA